MSPVEDRRFSSSRRQDWLEDVRRDAARAGRWEYYKPVAILVGAFIISIAVTMSQVKDAGLFASMLGALIGNGLFLLITVPVGIVAMLITCRILGADAGPVPVALLRLAAVYSVTLVIYLLMGSGCFTLLVSALIMAGMVAILFEMELLEGAVFTILSFGIFVGGVFMLAAINT